MKSPQKPEKEKVGDVRPTNGSVSGERVFRVKPLTAGGRRRSINKLFTTAKRSRWHGPEARFRRVCSFRAGRTVPKSFTWTVVGSHLSLREHYVGGLCECVCVYGRSLVSGVSHENFPYF